MNVLLITADQWRGDCLSAVGHPTVRTPNVDRLVADSVLFERHYTQAAPCGPARASLLTGLYQSNHRVCRNGTPLDDRLDNLARMARRLGHRPTLFGYTDTAPDPREHDPGDPLLTSYEGVLPGFEVGMGYDDHADNWLSWLRGNGVPLPDKPLDVYRPVGQAHVDPPTDAAAGYPAEHSEAAFLVDALTAHVGQRAGPDSPPWFAHLSLLRPHPPFIAPAPYNTMYAAESGPDFVRAASMAEERASHPFIDYALQGMPKHSYVYGATGAAADWDDDVRRQLRATYYGLISEVDAQLGRLFDALRDIGEYDDTLIVLTSDHGEMAGDHYLLGKLGYFDQSYHIPLIVRQPGAAANGTRVTEFSEAVDIVPTIVELLGGTPAAHLDGRSLVPFLNQQPPADWRDAAHFEFDFREVLKGTPRDLLDLDDNECQLAVIRDERFKYVHFGALPPLLFDLQADPGELNNVAEHPDFLATRLHYAEAMLRWRARHLDQTITGVQLAAGGALVADGSRYIPTT